MPGTGHAVLRVALRPLDVQRRSWLDGHFGAGSICCEHVTTSFADVDEILLLVRRHRPTVLIVEPLAPDVAAALLLVLDGVELWRQAFVEEPSRSRPWEKTSKFDAYQPVR